MSLKTKVLKELQTRPRTLKQLQQKFGNNRALARAVKDLEREKRITKFDGVYVLKKQTGQNKPAQIVKLGKGFAFAKLLNEDGEVFIPAKYLMGALPQDEILVQVLPSKMGSPNGVVTEITKEHNTFVGVYETQHKQPVFVADDFPAYPVAITGNTVEESVQDGDKVALQITHRGRDYQFHAGEIVMRFGSASSAKECAEAIVYGLGIPQIFSPEALAQAKTMPVHIAPEDTEGRLDLRDKLIFTIDSASTKDIDDAISIEKTKTGYAIGVHIADVSHYVLPHTAIDKDAYTRGTSVYYADEVIPMLPKELSNGICSLNEGVDRLAFSCLMEMNNAGTVESFRFAKTVIHSVCKGVYSEINELLEQESPSAMMQEKYAEVLPSLHLMHEVYTKLDALRIARGSMEIETSESKIITDQNGKAVDIEKRERGTSEKMIEEFMLLANTCAAKQAESADLPFLHRVHDKPDIERVERLRETLTLLNVPFHFAKDIPTQTELAKLLNETKGTPLETAVHFGVLRTMAKAIYSPEAKGHYGLALQDYAHFTSPIRRYPDLFVHRVLSSYVAGKPAEEIQKRYANFAEKAATTTTAAEIRAMTAERDVTDCYKAEYMRTFIGETFTGHIVSVAQHGVYVELPNTVEGLLPTEALTSGETSIQQGVSITDVGANIVYSIGKEIEIKVAGVDVAKGHIDFVLANSKPTTTPIKQTKGKRK